MNIKLVDLKTSYPIVLTWLEERNWPIIPKEKLSDFGFMVYNNEQPILAAWLYPVMTSGICWFGFPISTTKTTKQERNDAFDLLMQTVHITAKDMGYSYIMTTSDTPPVVQRLLKHNYDIGDVNVTQYWGKL